MFVTIALTQNNLVREIHQDELGNTIKNTHLGSIFDFPINEYAETLKEQGHNVSILDFTRDEGM